MYEYFSFKIKRKNKAIESLVALFFLFPLLFHLLIFHSFFFLKFFLSLNIFLNVFFFSLDKINMNSFFLPRFPFSIFFLFHSSFCRLCYRFWCKLLFSVLIISLRQLFFPLTFWHKFNTFFYYVILRNRSTDLLHNSRITL